jgi:hypothetical protein
VMIAGTNEARWYGHRVMKEAHHDIP